MDKYGLKLSKIAERRSIKTDNITSATNGGIHLCINRSPQKYHEFSPFITIDFDVASTYENPL